MNIRLSMAAKREAAVACVIGVLTLPACGGSDSGGSTSGGGGGGDKAAAAGAQQKVDANLEPITDLGLDIPLNTTPEKGKVAYAIRYNTETSNGVEEFKEIAETVGWTGRVMAIDAADPQSGSNAIKQAVSAGAGYIMLNGNNLDQLGAGIEVAKKANVPIYLFTGVGEPKGQENGVYGNVADLNGIVDFTMALMDFVIADSGGTGGVLNVNYPDAAILAAAEPIIAEQFKAACPDCTYQVLGLSTDQLLGGDLAPLIVAELRKNPDIKYVEANLSTVAVGLREALDNAGLNDVKILIGNPTDAQFDNVRDGSIDMISAFGVREGLYATLDMMLRQDQGMDPDQAAHASPPFQLYSKDTIGSATGWSGPEGFEQKYKELWKVN